MRAVFAGCLILLTVGLVFFLAVGLLHR